jgi:inhibitor of cysteine peptidase
MKSKLFLMIVSITVLIFLIACTPTPITPGQVSIRVDCDDLTASKHITNLTVDLPVSDLLKVTLCSNQTTGFKWSEEAEISDKTVLEQIDHKYEPPEDNNIVGGAGEEVWIFKALKKGTTEVSLEYSQSWEGAEKAAWTFASTIVVK